MDETSAARRDRPVAGDGLLHPVAIAALVVLVANDHWLKHAWPSPLTGKLSDVAGLILTPLVAQATVEVVQWRAGRWKGPSQMVLVAAAAVVAIAFALVKTVPAATGAYGIGVALLQWPISALVAVLGADPPPPLRPVVLIRDPTDLLALPSVSVALLVGSRRAR